MNVATTIWTVRELLENGYSVAKWCPMCGTWIGELDLAGLVAAGYGNGPPRDLPLRHRKCGTRVTITIHPPRVVGGPMSPGISATPADS